MSAFTSAARFVLGRIVRTGSLTIEFDERPAIVVGSGAPHGVLSLEDPTAGWDIVRHGIMGFAEAYMDGRVDTPDLQGLLRWAAENHDAWFRSVPGRMLSPLRRWWVRLRPERRHPRVTTMLDHYNLGNDFYLSWLDDTVTYSSARFRNVEQSLEDAQRHKYETIAQHVGLEPGMHVLEIGCGWGGFSVYAAETYGCHVVGVTISQEQADFARKRIAGLGLSDRVAIRLEDFRLTEGTFDAVVSIEMIESIDETQWPDLFATMSGRMRPGAKAAMQVITIDDSLWEQYRKSVDFIQQYIFPGGQLPAPRVLSALATEVGLAVEQVETFGLDYARTLDHWHTRFATAWPQLNGRDGLDERFKRMWDLYLVLCEAGFRSGRVDVQQWVFGKG